MSKSPEPLRRMNFLYPESWYEKLRREAFETKKTMTQISLEALELYFKQNEKDKEVGDGGAGPHIIEPA
jgi:hypothetical protein